MPSFFEYMSYMNCFYTSICGPYIDYNDHKDWIEQKGTYARIPSCWLQLLKWFFFLVLFGVIFSEIQPYFPLEGVLSKEFQESSFAWRVLTSGLCGTVVRSKYYLSWCVLQLNLIASGISYSKNKKGEDIWDYISWCDPYAEIPFRNTLKERIDKWNISPTKFFRLFIYQRLMSIVNIQLFCLVGVFGFNSMWHGLNAGYYVTLFVLVIPLIESQKCFYRFYQNKLIKHDKKIGKYVTVLSWIYVFITIAMMIVCMNLLDWWKIKQFLGDVYWFNVWMPVGFLTFFKITGIGQRSISQGNLKSKEPTLKSTQNPKN